MKNQMIVNASRCILISCILISGCALKVQLMPRDSGKMYFGTAMDSGSGSGTISITIDDRNYSGTWTSVSSGDTFGFAQIYGGGKSSFGSFQNYGGTRNQKAMLSTPDGRGLRCETTGDGMGHAQQFSI